jgi:hypothetical protein
MLMATKPTEQEATEEAVHPGGTLACLHEGGYGVEEPRPTSFSNLKETLCQICRGCQPSRHDVISSTPNTALATSPVKAWPPHPARWSNWSMACILSDVTSQCLRRQYHVLAGVANFGGKTTSVHHRLGRPEAESLAVGPVLAGGDRAQAAFAIIVRAHCRLAATLPQCAVT